MREGGKIYRPIAKMKGAQTDFEAWAEQHRFKAPPGVSISDEQLKRFLELRRRLDAVDEKNPLPIEQMRRNERPKLSEIEGMLEGVGGVASGRMDAYREIGMPPEEYRYLERVIYRQWLRPLRAKGLDPAGGLARGQGTRRNSPSRGAGAAVVAARLRSLAQSLIE